jgi:peptidoglycan hydrolase-like protein with peptidoglycan-binding domain
MLTSIASITLVAGLALVVVGLLGGGIEVKEIKVPMLPMIPRAASFVFGCVLVGLVLFDPSLFTTPQPPNPAPPPNTSPAPTNRRELGSAIPNLLEVRDVKRILQQLGYYTGPINNEPDDAYFQAVVNFQHAKNIKQDGLVGAETYGIFRDALPGFFGDKPPSR